MKMLESLKTLFENKSAFVEVILVNARGSTPADQGARAFVGENGLISGTVGGGKVEAKAIVYAQDLLENNDSIKCDFKTWNLQKDVGMTCGGEVSLFFQVHLAKNWNIAVFGAGHVAQALVKTLSTLSCQVTCIDTRPEWLEKMENSSNLTKILVDEPAQYVAKLPQDTFFVIMTKGHATDVPILNEVLKRKDLPYVGVIGSEAKKNVILNDLKNLGMNVSKDAFKCPIGLSLGDSAPEEIAISITAELIMMRDKYQGEKNGKV